ncbi:MAG: flagellar motor protein MotB [Planctomycetota bacterium]
MFWKRFTVLAIASAALSACVPQQKYDDLLTAYRGQEQQLLALQSDLATSRANEERLRAQLAEAKAGLEDMMNRTGGADFEAWKAKYADWLKQIANANLGPLPAELNQALADLAAQYPDVLTFDPRTGMLRFNSDFTFASGSAALNKTAEGLVGKLATILNTQIAQQFEVKVVGHTDNQPIRRVASQHPTNMHLSAHRAISVRDALVGDGVSANRMQIAGYGEFRPIVPNGPNGAAANRRVEIYLTPLTVAVAPTGNPVDAAAGRKAAPAPVKGKAKSDDDEPTK